ncbi:MAG: TIGR01777 family protein [Sulfurimonas sp. RIFCSPHIGHO2_12_FULL_36_9]|uniref:TIGR01777 family oxidoreductase n=1 Tax=Sulfurimonas sp. RIFCSPLOWO2_12_36_12 TaxID=1802253 RepID=UPI0008BE07E0|nr:TIGR01777 family oxidoreductase [Sulfurimonas sp. RIFCSPLOWO2_12_36_12]OHD98582.1 MAG: TIGR01777 family protein [Sulfurimonas sp. RIFCSPHIGHO2_12_FULL_36_9]OHD98657.1 MAG: TIGR01777 family protein [Sulfurimonas sp. RIFCSPLOWO2_02_FULL_36_28]OHE02793.1 MAG: TIGR01777 family protein [Sulfurimonas sp. RIFCSPLOWO2_12_36_12]OHE06771.1 MAG: TIGR01777 family protein [Sulfurimonas sp. RIFCSPLOWO2_12_FULL_36_74]
MSIGNKLKIAICGKSGLVGSKLDELFASQYNSVIGVKIRDNTSVEDVAAQIDKCDILINLSGTTILARWSDDYKKKLYSSRIDTTRKLVNAMKICNEKPKLFLTSSAVGIYDSTHSHDDSSGNFANDFLSKLCRDWEAEAKKAEELGIRTVAMRFGVIYSKDGGAMSKILPPFKMGVGGKLGRGDQMVSWIHIEDLLRAILFIIKTPAIAGSVNFTAPYPLSNIEQTYILGKVLNRPTFFGVPAFMIKLVFGEGARVILDSKEVYPTKLLENGFTFNYEKFENAIKEIVE